jgi:hypothetical protein
MHAEGEHALIVLKHGRGPISLVDIQIDDEDFVDVSTFGHS